ncbi:MAG: Nif11-like leader peptide family RiPP precursor [Lachnospiraceae bacterium]|nr:Nif11-like leader peptide family RiPP precursor [Lachnospiraceae bacterium]
MTENMKNFLKKVSEDKTLAEKVGKLEKAELIALAKELGIELTEADLAQEEGEISENEMDAVVGGYKRCVCIAGGGGKKDSEGDVCACVGAGVGLSKVDGEARCVCATAGTGYESLRELPDNVRELVDDIKNN